MTYNKQKAILLHGFSIAAMVMILTTACCCEDKMPPFEDQATPEWTYDRPFYVRPVDGVKPVKNFYQPHEVYTQNKLIQIPRPLAGDNRKAPRVAIWMTQDEGMKWTKVGYFGLQQEYFPYLVKNDGIYGFRFIGPGIPPADCKPPKPHITFIVDTLPPKVCVFISPDQEVYQVGQTITLDWCVSDLNLVPDSVEIGICLDECPKKTCWKKLGGCHSDEGTIDLVIPPQAAGKIFTIRVSARDRAGNLGVGFSCPLQIQSCEPSTTTRPANTKSATTKPCPCPAGKANAKKNK